MTTYDYRLIETPKEADLKALGAAGWRMTGYGTDARDGSLAWVVMECAGVEATALNPNFVTQDNLHKYDETIAREVARATNGNRSRSAK